jgi:hypothetical protein
MQREVLHRNYHLPHDGLEHRVSRFWLGIGSRRQEFGVADALNICCP